MYLRRGEGLCRGTVWVLWNGMHSTNNYTNTETMKARRR